MKMFPYTILNNISSQKYAPKSIPEPPDLACRHFLEAGAGSEGVSQKIQNMKVSPFTIPNKTFLSIDALNAMAEPPDLPWRHLFEPGAGFEGGIQKSVTQKCLLKPFTTIPLYQKIF